MQTTIARSVTRSGIGVHSGVETNITFKPAPVNTGIVFVRTDVSQLDNVVVARFDNVCDTSMSTSISNDAGVKVSTIEHIMAGIWGCGIDNMIVEIDNVETPIMDGSSAIFVMMIQEAGIQQQNEPKKIFKVTKEFSVSDNGSEIIISPSDQLEVNVTIDFDSAAIGKQSHSCSGADNFLADTYNARTFGFLRDLEYLKSKGLGRGASLENTIGIDNDQIMNPEGLRYQNEFARHKLLDLVGDFFCCGTNFAFKVDGYKTSHHLNNIALRKLFEQSSHYQLI